MGEELVMLNLSIILLSFAILMALIISILTSNDQPKSSRSGPKVRRVYLARTPSGKVYVYED